MPNCNRLSLFLDAFGPDRWHRRAMQVLGLRHRQVYDLAAGRARLTRRHVVRIDTYLGQRWRARSSIRQQEADKATRAADRALAKGEQARQTIRSLLKENG